MWLQPLYKVVNKLYRMSVMLQPGKQVDSTTKPPCSKFVTTSTYMYTCSNTKHGAMMSHRQAYFSRRSEGVSAINSLSTLSCICGGQSLRGVCSAIPFSLSRGMILE